jgi:hypothetical protein
MTDIDCASQQSGKQDLRGAGSDPLALIAEELLTLSRVIP